MKRNRKASSIITQTIYSALLLTQFLNSHAQDNFPPLLNGIGLKGYAQQSGIKGASFNGGTEVYIFGQRFSMYPSQNVIQLTQTGTSVAITAPPLSSDNEFSSNVGLGVLAYSSPDISRLYGGTVPLNGFNAYDSISYQLGVLATDASGSLTNSLQCTVASNCFFTMSRAFTPVVLNINPSVVYFGAAIAISVDPKGTQAYKAAGEWPFVEARIDSHTVDFQVLVNGDTQLGAYSVNQVFGYAGDQTPALSSKFLMKFPAGNTIQQEERLKKCSYDQGICYQVQTVPKIDSISAHAGYSSGGQPITITGHGFNSPNISIMLDGTPCLVTAYNLKQITCMSSSRAAPSTNDTDTVGQHGLRRRIFNNSGNGFAFSQLTSLSYREALATEFETAQNNFTQYGNTLSGWFKAPASTNYKFYVSCDDYCQLQISNSNTSISGKMLVHTSPGFTSFRNYWTLDGSRNTTWLPLLKDSYYFLEARHTQGAGSEHLSVAVEIEQPSAANHPNSVKQMQRLILNGTYVRQSVTLKVTKPDNGTLYFIFRKLTVGANNVLTTDTQQQLMYTNSTAQQVEDAFQPYFTRNCEGGCRLVVTRASQDANGTATTDPAKIYFMIFTFTVQKALVARAWDTATTLKVSSNSSFSAATVLGTKPLTGNFKVQCFRSDGTSSLTGDLPYNSSPYSIASSIGAACTEYRDNLDIFDTDPNFPYEDGRDLWIRFTGVGFNALQFTLVGGTVPLANLPSIAFYSISVTQQSNNIFYSPIPFDLLYTNETMPQAIVSVNGQPAVCASLSCSYSYISPQALIHSFSLVNAELTITGANLPAQITELSYSNVACAILSQSDTTIVCKIAPTSVSGTWHPSVKDSFGIIPVEGSVSTATLGVTVTSVTPSTDLNPAGQNLLTISGQNFPLSTTDGNQLSVAFSDGTKCQIVSCKSTEITCMSPAFDPKAVSSPIKVIVAINGQVDMSQTVSASTAPARISAINPRYASPVLKANITLRLSSSFSGALQASDLEVRFVSLSNPSYFKLANVIDVDSVSKAITVRFGGAPSGDYKVLVFSAANGAFDTTSLLLTTIGTVNSISPNTGSIYGGQLVTIQGYNFSSDPLDNPVQIEGRDCDVISSSNTQIVCRTPLRTNPVPSTELLLAFLSTSEEAVCNVPTASGGCNYTWSSSGLPVLTSYEASFDPILSQHVVTFHGNGFTGDVSSVEVFVDGKAQPLSSVTLSTVTAVITSFDGPTSKDIQLYFPYGTPSGYKLLENGITLTPAFVQITPNVGSPAGSLITATVSGVGPGLIGQIRLLTDTGDALCSGVVVVGYGKVQCKTTAIQIAASTAISFQVNSTIYACANEDPMRCNYSTSTAMPVVTSTTLSGDKTKLTLIGSGFLTSGFDASVSFAGIPASSVSIDGDSQATATFLLGVPTSEKPIVPVLVFTSTASATAHWATTSSAAVANPFLVPSAGSQITCSFAGGCLLTVVGQGLASNLLDMGTSRISLCGQECPLSVADSSAQQASCLVPSLATSFSIFHFNTSMASDITLKGQFFSSNPLYRTALFDGNNLNNFGDSSNNSYAGVQFQSGFVGILTQVKFYMNAFTPSSFINNLKLQGSNDGASYASILTVGAEIHTGWNYYSFEQDGSQPQYQYYRIFAAGGGGLIVGELVLRGRIGKADSNPSYSCAAQLVLDGVVFQLPTTVEYANQATALLQLIRPRFGTVKGGTAVTFSGTGFVADYAQYTITIDGVKCTPTAATITSVTCTTGKRPGLVPNSTLSIQIAGQGKVATQDLLYIYVNPWSDTTTWGGEFQPMDGETVWIPAGLNLLFDLDRSPKLNAVLVEGSLLFAPNPDPDHQASFDANYILVNGGKLEVGTEEFPYSSKLTITMHGTKGSPGIPIYGNKVIGVRNGVLDLHGVARNPVWTELKETADAGAFSITLSEAVDWQAGEEIVIAPTSYSSWEAERRTIVSVDHSDSSAPVLTLDRELLYKHYAAVETYGGQIMKMRAEVGLLTRNLIVRGDPETSSANQYGAHIMLHSMGDESVVGRIENVELFDVGQAFQLGRYPIHFHMIGTVHSSYVRGNSIHQTYNRAVTFHGVHYLRVINNVAFDTMGHTFFFEDAIETNNILDGNLAILTKRSWSLLNTDQTPASFWVTNPYNILRNNRAAGSERYGFWYDLKPHPTGPSYDPTICPDHMPLGEFSNNAAHSNGRYGLWLFHKHIPSAKPCSPIVYDTSRPSDPYWQNPLITADYAGFTTYKNGECGIMLEEIGDVKVTNASAADNIVAGIEVSVVSGVKNGRAMVDGALVVGCSGNSEQRTLESRSWGLITARSEGFSVHNVAFHRLDQPGMAALGSCSHCFHAAATDSGARTVEFSGLSFDPDTAPRRIHYQFPWKAIYFDIDGTLTRMGPKTWATPYWEHNNQPECQHLDVEFDGLVCNETVEVRRLAFYGYEPSALRGLELGVLQWDDTIVQELNATSLEAYKKNSTAYSAIPFKQAKDPNNAWAVPFVTNHKYKIHWGHGSNDFTQMRVDLSTQWMASDHSLQLVTNFTDTRARVNFTAGGVLQPNQTLTNRPNELWQTGDNIVYNDTATRELQFAINGRNNSKASLLIEGERCIGPCFGGIGPDAPVEDTIRLWSDTKSWPSGTLPRAGDDVVINSTWNMILDLPITPVLNYLEVNGKLSFKNGMNITLQANIIFVRAGELNIGNSSLPFEGQATILLHGDQASQSKVYQNNIDSGNKMIANTARINMYGQPRSKRMARLLATANPGDLKIVLEAGLDWVAGDKIGLAPTAIGYMESDYAQITDYDLASGVATLDRPLANYHWGAGASTAPQYSGTDMRGEVLLLTRNVKVQGTDTDSWGCQFITSDFFEADNIQRIGRSFLSHVEVFNCSQYDNAKAALRFDSAYLGYSSVTNCSLHHGLGWGFNTNFANNIVFQDNVLFSFVQFGVLVQNSANLTLDSNIVAETRERSLSAQDGFLDKAGGFIVCSFDQGEQCQDVRVTNNIVAGAHFYGFAAPGHSCGDYSSPVFYNNVAHSVKGPGAHIFADPNNPSSTSCLEASYFTAYKCSQDGIVTYAATDSVIFSHMVLIDNGWGASINIGKEGDKLSITFKDSVVYGETEARDCAKQNECSGGRIGLGCIQKHGLMLPVFANGAKPVFPSMSAALPIDTVSGSASWGGNAQVQDVTFSGFTSGQTYCGMSQSVFALEGMASDYVPPVYFSRTKFSNVDQSALAYLFDPPQSWAIIDDCGQFPCTGPLNTFLSFSSTYFTGSVTPDNTQPSFEILPNNPVVVKAFGTKCSFVKLWNAFYCSNSQVSLLLFESLDEDKSARTFSPMYITCSKTGFVNVLNEFMDRTWDGFYTGQVRLSRFPSIIQTGGLNEQFYNISYTGTPPNKQRFKLIAESGSLTARVEYPKAGTYIVSDSNGNTYPRNGWDDSLRAPGLIKGQACGENRFLGVVNALEFVLKAGCSLYISPIDAIQATIRLQWDLASFYGDGGSTRFVARFAAALGIVASDIKIVSVYQGSVIVQYSITSSSKDPYSALSALKQKITSLIQTGGFGTSLGAPVIEGSFDQGATIAPNDSNLSQENTTKDKGGEKSQGEKDLEVASSKNKADVTALGSQGSLSERAKLAIVVALIVVGVGVAIAVLVFVCLRHRKDAKQARLQPTGHTAPGLVDEEIYLPQHHPKAEVSSFSTLANEGKYRGKAIQIDQLYQDDGADHTEADHLQNRTEDSMLGQSRASIRVGGEDQEFRSSKGSPGPFEGLTKKSSEGSPDEYYSRPQGSSPGNKRDNRQPTTVISRTPGGRATKIYNKPGQKLSGLDSDEEDAENCTKKQFSLRANF